MEALPANSNQPRGDVPRARVVATWNGIPIRAETSRGGMVFTVGDSRLSFPTLEAAMARARKIAP